MSQNRSFLFVLLLCVFVLGVNLKAGLVDELAILEASDGETEDEFGYSLDVSGQWAVIGARSEDNGDDENIGAVYFFHTTDGSSWTQQQKLRGSDSEAYDLFGNSVAIDGNYAVVGAPYNEAAIGAAYIFYYNGSTWTQQAKLTASDGATTDFFGWSVAISGSRVVVSAPNEDTKAFDAGTIYVFRRSGTTWTQEAKLTASDGASGDILGGAVAMDGAYIVAGARNSDHSGLSSGTAYVYYFNGSSWSQQARLAAFDADEYDHFSTSVTISGDWLAVGSPGDSDGGAYSGSVYVYARSGSTWTYKAKLTASDAGIGDSFGISTSMNGDLMLIGASGEQVVYPFEWDGTNWVERPRVSYASTGTNDYYGYSVALGEDYALIGAYGVGGFWDDEVRIGAVYAYDRLSLYIASIYRFWAPNHARHFYTISQSERDKLINNYSDVWTYEYVAYYAYHNDAIPGTSPIYRFWSSKISSHFYTINESERDKLINNFPSWTHEGPVFYAYKEGQQPDDASPVYRFWSDSKKTHFYTISESEKDKLINQFSHVYTYEGIVWYAYQE